MKQTVELDQDIERRLRDLAQRLKRSENDVLQDAIELAFTHPLFLMNSEPGAAQSEAPIISTPGVMGGDACIRRTRISVWALVGYKKDGLSDAQILSNFPHLSAADLVAAWDHYAAHSEQVEAERRLHEEAG